MASKLAALLLVLCLLTGAALGEAATPTDLPGPSTDPAETEPQNPQEPEDPQDPQNPEQGQGEEGEGQGEEKNVTPVITLDGAVEDKNHLWHSTLNPEATLVFRWTAEGAADSWRVNVAGPGGYTARDTGTGAAWRLPEKDLAAGNYSLTLTLYRGETNVGAGELRFVLEAPADDPGEDTGSGYEVPDENPGGDAGSGYEVPGDDPGEDPEEKPAGKPTRPNWSGRGSGRGAGRSGSMGFTVTPGKALTSQHARGSGTVMRYGTVALELPETPMETLTLGGEILDIACEGTVFHGAVEGDTLTLTAEAEGRWTVGLAALETLARSGVDTLVLAGTGGETTLPTALTPSGDSYARERAKGFVATDFLLLVEEEGLWLQVEDRVYDLEDETMRTGG